MERIVMERTTPVQGQLVTIKVKNGNGPAGEFVLSFFEWLHFSKLLKAGMEYQKGRDEQRVEVVIVGKDQPVPPSVAKGEVKVEQPKQKPLAKVTDDEVGEYLVPAPLGGLGAIIEDTVEDEQPRSLRGDNAGD
jgi:hypothetical protein